MGYGQNIDEERRMRLNHQVMVGLKEGSGPMGNHNMGTKWKSGC
jgi:hypothetical protein